MTTNEPNLALRRVTEALGGANVLAERLGVHRNSVFGWQSGLIALPKERRKQIKQAILAHAKELRELGRQL